MRISYYLFDGDLVGQRIDELLLTSSDQEVGAFSRSLDQLVRELARALESSRCTVVYAGGDSILARGILSDHEVQHFQDWFYSQAGVTISVGIGDTKAACILALKLAKARRSRRFRLECDG
jgi:GTP cyclohydrolase III